MSDASSHPQNLDDTPVAASSTSGASSLVDLLRQEVAELRRERDALRQEKRGDKLEIERLTLLLDKLKRMLFGRKSEKLLRQIEQLELELEEAYINEGERQEALQTDTATPATAAPRPVRQPLPDHLPRETKEHLPADPHCPDCGGEWKRLGEDASEVLELVRVRFHVVRHVRPRLACSCCDRIVGAGSQPPHCPRLCRPSAAGPYHDLEVSGSFASVSAGADLCARRRADQRKHAGRLGGRRA